MEKKPEFQISGYREKEFKEKLLREKKLQEEKTIRNEEKIKKKTRKENRRIEIAEAWDTVPFAQILRGLVLITQSIFRKYILFPLLIIAKNVGRLLFLQRPEWSEDFDEWNKERHVKCTYNGVQLSENEFPKNWLTDGIQIKIVFPFCLKPWHITRIRPSRRDQITKKEQNQIDNSCFLTVWGTETDLIFGPSRKRPSFFKPIFKQFEKKIRKFPNKRKNWIIEILLFLKKKMLTGNPILVFWLREKSNERKNEKDSINNNYIIHESSIQTQFLNWANSSVTETKMKDLATKTRLIKNQIEKISKDNRKRNINSNKTRYGTKRFESSKNTGQIIKRGNARLTHKTNYILKFIREKIYVDIFLYIINIPRINTKLFLESTKNLIDKSISNNKKNNERINKTTKNKIHFISNIKKAFLPFLSNHKITKNLRILSDFSPLSQAYVFYKLSQAKTFDLYLYKLKTALQYRGISLFLKNEIKNYFGTQGIISSEIKTQKLANSGMNQWKNWLKLKSNYQYDLSQIKWSQLVPQKWRNRVTQHCEVENTNNYEPLLFVLPNQKSNFKKNYRYDVLSSKFVYYEDKNDSYRYIYGVPFQINKTKKFFYTYNNSINKDKFIDMWWNIPITDYLGIKNIMEMDIEKNTPRKYFDLKILHFCLRKKIEIDTWVDISTGKNENTKTELKNYQIVDKIDPKGIFYLPIYQEPNQSHKKKNFFDWMGMNEEILSRPISNLEFWFFSEFVLFYNAYKRKPWIIPIYFLFSNSNVSQNVSANKNINRKKKTNPFIPIPSNENEKKYFESENQNHDENELISQETLGSDVQEDSESVLSNGEKDIEEDYTGSDMKKPRKKKQSKSGTETERELLVKRYFVFQLRWDKGFEQKLFNNIKVYCLLLKLINPIDVAISALERKEMNIDLIPSNKGLVCTGLVQKGLLMIEPVPLFVKVDGQFIMYQTIGISLVHKSKHPKNQKRYNENVAKKIFCERDKSNFDLLAPENIFSARRRRELRIRICLNSRNNNGMNTKPTFYNRNRLSSPFFDENKNLDQDKNTLRKLKFFLWPNYRLEDLACMNRYWFDTNNGSRFSLLRIHMYPQLKMHL
nr:hypothetical chloroplast RF1 [Celosia argentea]